jgi:hypothetical protein
MKLPPAINNFFYCGHQPSAISLFFNCSVRAMRNRLSLLDGGSETDATKLLFDQPSPIDQQLLLLWPSAISLFFNCSAWATGNYLSLQTAARKPPLLGRFARLRQGFRLRQTSTWQDGRRRRTGT